jgi:KDO2-lipid IV(A) lauroyltransferase
MAGVKWGYWGFKLAFWAAPKLPRWLGYRLTAIGGELYFWLFPSHSHKAVENYAIILADDVASARVRLAARRSFRNYGRYLVDFVRAPKMGAGAGRNKVQFDRWDAIEEAMRGGRGVIFVLMHFGNWDMGGPALAERGHKVNVIAQTFEHDALNEAVVAARQVRGMNVIPAEHAAMGIVRALKRGEVLGILIDRPMADGGVEVPFFGSPVVVPAGPAWIALRTGACILPAALVRARDTEDVTHALVDLDVAVTPSGDIQRDVVALTRRILEAHERFIRAYPDQWFMFRPMWPPAREAKPAGTEPALAAEG